MRALAIGLCGGIVIGVCGAVAFGQGAGAPRPPVLGGLKLNLKPETGKAIDYPASSIEAAFREGLQQKVYAFRILEGGTYNINIRTQVAPEDEGRIHQRIHDLYMIRSGEATLVTGGELVDAKKGENDATELSGAIRNGLSRAVKPGDMIFIPAGVPHQVTKVTGNFQFALVRWHEHK